MSDRLLRRMACLVEIADQKEKLPGKLGKTAMQKLTYLLQALHEVELGYDFSLYTYGPYDSAVMRDLDYGAATGLLDVEFNETGGYTIGVGQRAEALDAYRKALKEEIGEELNKLIERFGSMTAKELELRATIVFVKRDDPAIDDDSLVKLTKDLKPRFDEREIRDAIRELRAIESF